MSGCVVTWHLDEVVISIVGTPAEAGHLLDRALRRGLISAAKAQADDGSIAATGKFIGNPINETD